MLESSPKRSYMETLLKNKLGFPVRLVFAVRSEKSESPCQESEAPPPPGPGRKKALIRENPLIETAIELFDATIEDVRE